MHQPITYTIVVRPNFYEGTLGAPTTHRLTINEVKEGTEENCLPLPDGWEVAVFPTKEEAQAVVDRLEASPYYLQHGEAGRPEYIIMGDNEEPMPETVYKIDALEDGWWATPENCIPEEIRKKVAGSNVEYYCGYNTDYLVYRGNPVEYDGYQYCVAYVVSALAIQDADGDLDTLKWETPIYFCAEL